MVVHSVGLELSYWIIWHATSDVNLSIRFVDNTLLREDPQRECSDGRRGLGMMISGFAIWMRVDLCASHLHADGNTNFTSTPAVWQLFINVRAIYPFSIPRQLSLNLIGALYSSP